MASAVTSQRIASKRALETLPHKPASTSATVVTLNGSTFQWRDMRDYETFGFGAANHTLTGNGITLLEIVAASDTSGTNTTVVVSSGTLSGTVVGNGGFLECTAAQIKEVALNAGVTLRYVAGRITLANSSDTACVTYDRDNAFAPASGLTPATF